MPRINSEGTRTRAWGIEAYVKVGRRQVQTTFAIGTDFDEIQEWRLKTRRQLTSGRAERGTLAADIEALLATLKDGSRRKIDFNTWLALWKDALGDKPRLGITLQLMQQQFAGWQAEKYSESSLNKLRTYIISLWKWRDGRFHKCPALEIPKFKEVNVRKGFFEHDEFTKIRAKLPPDHADLATFLYYAGWRHAEARELTWDEVDLAGGVIRLSAERSKNDDGRLLPIEGPIKTVIERRLTLRVDGLPFVFHYRRGKKSKPRKIGDWRRTWASACEDAECQGKLIHDFRRTVVRNLTRAKVPEKVAMSLTGHKTRSVFDRYNIVNEDDLRAASARLSAHLEEKASSPDDQS